MNLPIFRSRRENTSSNSFGEHPPIYAISFIQINISEFQISENRYIHSDLVVPMMTATNNAKPLQNDEAVAQQHLKDISAVIK